MISHLGYVYVVGNDNGSVEFVVIRDADYFPFRQKYPYARQVFSDRVIVVDDFEKWKALNV